MKNNFAIRTSRPEFQLLLECARISDETGRLSELAASVTDWEWTLSEANRHGLIPAMFLALSRVGELPRDVASRVESNAREQMLHGLVLTARLFEVSSMLEAAGIDCIPYKGPTLGALAYGNPAFRPSVDLDILVRPDQVRQAKDVLLTAGFKPASYIEDHREHLLLNCICEYEFTSADGSYTVEIHWKVLSQEFGFNFPDHQVWTRTQNVSVGGKSLRTLGNEDLLLALAAHGTRHLWNRLLWIVDIAQITARRSIDWDLLVERANEYRVRRMLFLALSLAHGLLQAPIPGEVLRLIRKDASVRRLHRTVTEDCLHDPRVLDRTSRHKFLLSSLERWQEKFRYIRQVALTPQVGDLIGTDHTAVSTAMLPWLRLRSILGRVQRRLLDI